MASNELPDRDTLLMWISAYFDGELHESEEAQLFAAMEEDSELESEFLAMDKLLGGGDSLPALTDAIMGAVAPEAVSATPAGAALLASAQIDDELDPAGTDRLNALLASSDAAEQVAAEVASFAHVAEGVSVTLRALPDTDFVRSATAGVAAKVVDAVETAERAATLFSAALDDELSADEQSALDALIDAGAVMPLELEPLQELLAVALQAPAEDPAAARAGEAALQAIAASAELAAAAAKPRASVPAQVAPTFMQRLRAALGGFAAPLSLATAAAAIFMLVRDPSADQTPQVDPDAPPAEWVAWVGQDIVALADTLRVLDDNSETEVQAVDSGSQLAAVFSTEATSITVIWVPEPDSGILEETGT